MAEITMARYQQRRSVLSDPRGFYFCPMETSVFTRFERLNIMVQAVVDVKLGETGKTSGFPIAEVPIV